MPFPGLKSTIEKLSSFDFGQEMIAIVEDNQEKIPEYIREQLASGRDGDDKPVTIFGRDFYADRTIQVKEREGVGLGAVTDHITNYMSGAFFESLKIETEGEVFEANSDVSYFDEIQKRSPDALLEIDEKNRRDFAETVTLPAIKESLKSKTGLTIS